jgi:hypothetical protein
MAVGVGAAGAAEVGVGAGGASVGVGVASLPHATNNRQVRRNVTARVPLKLMVRALLSSHAMLPCNL